MSSFEKYQKYKNKYQTVKTVYDFIIVGGGSAGCVLASRLSADPHNQVLLLEAGPNFAPDDFPPDLTDTAIIGSSKYEWHRESISGRVVKHPIDMSTAKVIGGCSAHNATAAIRAIPLNFINWNIPGWSFEEVLPYYKKLENTDFGSDTWHGRTGPLPIRHKEASTPVTKAFIQSALNNGFKYIKDFNNGEQNGVGTSSRNAIDEIRENTAMTYLSASVRSRPNLTIIGKTEVDHILFPPDTKTAIGVHTKNKNKYQSKNKIIISAGTFGSATILMRSGIGPEDELTSLNIPLIHNLPVGQTLYDHPFYYCTYKLKKGIEPSSSDIGPLLWTNSSPDVESLNIQIVAFTRIDTTERTLTMGIGLTQPESVGSFRLTGTHRKSLIDVNFFSTESDRRHLLDGVKLSRKIARTPPLSDMIESADVPDDDLMEDILETVESFGHPCGTVPIGPVLDQNCRVHGTTNLYVVDASIFPRPISAPLNLTVIMCAEKISYNLMSGVA